MYDIDEMNNTNYISAIAFYVQMADITADSFIT